MRLKENLHHSDQSSGTTICERNGTEIKVHWTEGYSPAVITRNGHITGMILATEDPELDKILAAPGEKARPMTTTEEKEWAKARNEE